VRACLRVAPLSTVRETVLPFGYRAVAEQHRLTAACAEHWQVAAAGRSVECAARREGGRAV